MASPFWNSSSTTSVSGHKRFRFSTLIGDGTKGTVDGSTVRRFYDDVFEFDAPAFFAYCRDLEPIDVWRPAVDYLAANDDAVDFFFNLLSAGRIRDDYRIDGKTAIFGDDGVPYLSARDLLRRSQCPCLSFSVDIGTGGSAFLRPATDADDRRALAHLRGLTRRRT